MITKSDFEETTQKGIYSLIKTGITEKEMKQIIKQSKNFAGLVEKEYSMRVVREMENLLEECEKKQSVEDTIIYSALKKLLEKK